MKKMTLFLFIILCMFASCSRLDLAVNLANSYISNKADDFFDLTREQSKWLKQALERDIDQVKKTIFPQLAEEMHKISQTLENQKTFNSMTVINSYKRLENLFYEGGRLFAPDAVTFVNQLTSKQIEYFQRQANKIFSEMKKKPNEKSYIKIKKQFDSWAGGMNSAQKKELQTFVVTNPPPINESIYNRQYIVYEFVKSFPDKDAREKYVERLFTHYDSVQDPLFKKVLVEKHNRVAIFVTNVLNKMSEDQKKTLVETIRDRANQLLRISKG
jgi:hypothetical protein